MATRQPWEMFTFFNDVAPIWGARLWCFLNEGENVAAMMRASDSAQPAAGAIAAALHERFGDHVRQDRVKQFTGLLIRRVMEDNGYHHQSYGHACGDNPVFSVASVYRRTQ